VLEQIQLRHLSLHPLTQPAASVGCTLGLLLTGLSQALVNGLLTLPNRGAVAHKAAGTLDEGLLIMLDRKCWSFLRPTPLWLLLPSPYLAAAGTLRGFPGVLQ